MKLTNMIKVGIMAMLFAGCQKEFTASIDSLNSDGDEFFCNQKVKVWMGVNSDNLPKVTYKWYCDSGKFTQPNGINEEVWQAPNTPGIYKVWCTISIDGKSETRYHDMNVSAFFFEKFEKNTYAFKGQSSTTLSQKTETVNGVTNGYLQAVAKTTTSANRYIYYNFGNPDLHVPFSCMATVGYITTFPTDNVKVKTSTSDNKFYYQVTCNRDPDKADTAYIDDLRFEWFPVGRTSGLPLDPVTGVAYNGCFKFEQNRLGSKTWYQVSVNVPELNQAIHENKNVAVNIGADYIVKVYVAGTLVLQTDAIQQWRTDNNAKDDIYINEWRLVFPNGNGGNNPPNIYFDNAYAKVDGTLMTGL